VCEPNCAEEELPELMIVLPKLGQEAARLVMVEEQLAVLASSASGCSACSTVADW